MALNLLAPLHNMSFRSLNNDKSIIPMQFPLNKYKQVISLLFILIFFTVYPSQAKNITANNHDILSLSISCPDNPQCIYSKGNTLQLNISIKNNTDQNLKIPLEAMTHITTSFYFKSIHDGKNMDISDPSWMQPVLFKELTLLPAYRSIIISTIYVISDDKEIKRTPTNHIIFYAKTITPVLLHDSEKPIGFYQNGNFKPKQFMIEAKQIITKK